MDIHHIKYFLAVCDELNFTRAAERCHVSQPALSRAIRHFEDEIGGLLFHRDRNLIDITELGQFLRQRLQEVVDKLDGIQREARQFLMLEKASVALGLVSAVGQARLKPALAGFQAQYPGVTVRLVEGESANLAHQLEQGNIDLAVMVASNELPDRFNRLSLYHERVLVAFRARHRFAGMNEVPLREINRESYLQQPCFDICAKVGSVLKGSGGQIRLAAQSQPADWLQNMIAAGLGVGFVSEFDTLVQGVQARPTRDPEIWRDICLVTVAGRRLSPAEIALAKVMHGHCWPQSRFSRQLLGV